MIPIEKGIPIPPISRGKYPLADMLVGEDSIFIANGKIQSISGYTHQWGKRNNKKFVCRADEKEGVAGIRVWRIE